MDIGKGHGALTKSFLFIALLVLCVSVLLCLSAEANR